MKAIVAVNLNWGIGCEGKLLQFIPEDMKFFKDTTIGNIVVMGRKTFESLPGKNPLKDRINIVLTKDEAFKDERLVICNSVETTLKKLKKYDNDKIFIIGGETIYKQFLPYCNELYITKTNNNKKADKFFPNIDTMQKWILVEESEEKEHHNIKYVFTKYVHNDLKS